jgi:hypothetical protein
MPDSEPDQPTGSRWRAIVGLALIAAVILGVLFMARQLRQASVIQDCVASGRTNCAPIERIR